VRATFVPTVCGLVCGGVFSFADGGWAQEAPVQNDAAARAARIRELQAQAAQLQSELEALNRTQVAKKPPAVKKPAAGRRPPDGVARSTATREEFAEQPTRHMRESLESLPGMVVRQGEGPRDFTISIRGSGAGGGR
jgi:iron complex outermembrane receptor protein